eukprot:TRINITY_DN671_c0_g1_i1.p1 TRINITY_DN671_c0_g1~~TRINITY_DN671_c0_g1_i1.p1  ORF type:complete len:395 (-),score=75.00 TRINITY_DN671_c0_g1_i1:46-1230(-)
MDPQTQTQPHPVEGYAGNVSDYGSWMTLFRLPAICLFLSAILTIVIASKRSYDVDKYLNKDKDLKSGLTLKSSSILVIPIVGSVTLVVYFFFFDIMSFISGIATCVIACYGVVFLLTPLGEKYFPSVNNKNIWLPFFGNLSLFNTILTMFALLCVVVWLWTGHWVLNNLFGISLCVLFISFIRVTNVKIAGLILVALFAYDIFWVFYSDQFFGKSVMVEVASKEAANPAKIIADQLHIPTPQSLALQIPLPNKLIWGNHMLGLGDIAVPGIILAYLYRLERYLKKIFAHGLTPKFVDSNNNTVVTPPSPQQPIRQKSQYPWYGLGYFYSSLGGYALGLFVTMIMAFVYHIPQPALLYLVPGILIPIIIVAYLRSESHLLVNELDISILEDKTAV